MSDAPSIAASAPKRPRFRFGLRTMFVVVTAVCIWVGWNVHVVQRRIRLRTLVELEGGQVWTLSEYESNPIFAHALGKMHRPTVAEVRRLFGDEGIVEIRVGRSSFGAQDKIRELESWFPEADVIPPPSGQRFVPAD